MFNISTIRSGSISLEAAGLIALADLSTIAQRTALTGTATCLDIFFLAPGIHCQQSAAEINRGELPSAGAMTSGYVFRIENPATVSYLQSIGRTGHLVTTRVKKKPHYDAYLRPLARHLQGFFITGVIPTVLYILGPVLTATVIILICVIRDWWALGVMGMLIVARLINVVIIRRRSKKGWKGALEPGVYGDLFIVLSQDRWIRMRGLVDDLKTVTAGQWLRDTTTFESYGESVATLLVYVSAALAGNASTIGSLLIACLLLVSVGLLGLCNSWTNRLQMFDCIVSVEGKPVSYERRMDLVNELVAESNRDDWALGMGLITKDGLNTTAVV
ncbi:hypothetical protein DXG03_002518 [Asterophora parasitica]|uniref:Uncharacterized protein n=1 Tax=Asterophora parasitica TaxID=117018 RepID=A0A9P7G2A3_9AGAR|nr:hypothetical protein DXG03_002518 [Asterophora parasitica]